MSGPICGRERYVSQHRQWLLLLPVGHDRRPVAVTELAGGASRAATRLPLWMHDNLGHILGGWEQYAGLGISSLSYLPAPSLRCVSRDTAHVGGAVPTRRHVRRGRLPGAGSRQILGVRTMNIVKLMASPFSRAGGVGISMLSVRLCVDAKCSTEEHRQVLIARLCACNTELDEICSGRSVIADVRRFVPA